VGFIYLINIQKHIQIIDLFIYFFCDCINDMKIVQNINGDENNIVAVVYNMSFLLVYI